MGVVAREPSGEGDGESDGDNTINGPSITHSEEKDLFSSPLINATVFSNSTKEGNSPIEITLNRFDKVKSLSYHTMFGIILTSGADGSLTAGSSCGSVGFDTHGNLLIEISGPSINSTQSGIDLTINKAVVNGLLQAAGFIIFNEIAPGSGVMVHIFGQ